MTRGLLPEGSIWTDRPFSSYSAASGRRMTAVNAYPQARVACLIGIFASGKASAGSCRSRAVCHSCLPSMNHIHASFLGRSIHCFRLDGIATSRAAGPVSSAALPAGRGTDHQRYRTVGPSVGTFSGLTRIS